MASDSQTKSLHKTTTTTTTTTTTIITEHAITIQINGGDVNSNISSSGKNGGSGSASMANDAFVNYFDSRFPKSIMIVLLVVGLVGNSLCLFIFTRKHMRKHSTFVYLACLAVVDLLVLALGCGDIVLIAYATFVVRSQSLIVCRLVTFLIYTSTHVSSFILAAVSIDRAIATNFITFSKVYCRPLTAYKVMTLCVAISVAINFHHLFFIGYTTVEESLETTPVNMVTTSSSSLADFYNGTSMDYVNGHNQSSLASSPSSQEFIVIVHCATQNGTLYEMFLDPYFKWIDLLAYAIVPFIIMLICTFLIVHVLFRSNRRLNKRRSPPNSTSTTTASTAAATAAATAKKKQQLEYHQLEPPTMSLLNNGSNTSTTAVAAAAPASNIKSNKELLLNTPAAVAASRTSKAKHLTYTLIILNCLFFCLVGPLLIVLVTLSDHTSDDTKLLINTVYTLAYANHSFNFILYGFSSPPFRVELFRILGLNRRRRPQMATAATAATAMTATATAPITMATTTLKENNRATSSKKKQTK